MRKLLFAGLVALLAPTASHAQVQLGLRVGYGLANGDAFKDNGGSVLQSAGESAKMSDTLKAQIPVQLDASYKLTPEVAAGVYFSYGVGQLNDKICSDFGITCDKSGSDLRFGAQGIYSFSQVGGPFLPWAGLSLGWEQGSAEYKFTSDPPFAPPGTLNGDKAKFTLSGWEVGLQVGGDYKLNEQFSVGPYLTYSFGQYTSRSVSLPAAAGNPPIDLGSTSHSWLGIGVMGKLNL
jgi:hypothetical protein